MTVEQMCRDLLAQAIADRLVAPERENWSDADPQIRSAGELTGVANLLSDYLRRQCLERDERWQLAVGKDLNTAERDAAAEAGG
jgi:hypothetical protein